MTFEHVALHSCNSFNGCSSLLVTPKKNLINERKMKLSCCSFTVSALIKKEAEVQKQMLNCSITMRASPYHSGVVLYTLNESAGLGLNLRFNFQSDLIICIKDHYRGIFIIFIISFLSVGSNCVLHNDGLL